jgi:hypothetical protein
MNALLDPELTDACERLKQSRNDCESLARSRGVKCGRLWAQHEASWDKLEELSRYDGGYTMLGLQEQLDDADRMCWEFAKELFGEDDYRAAMHNSSMIRGFIDGALNVWHQVSAKM